MGELGGWQSNYNKSNNNRKTVTTQQQRTTTITTTIIKPKYCMKASINTIITTTTTQRHSINVICFYCKCKLEKEILWKKQFDKENVEEENVSIKRPKVDWEEKARREKEVKKDEAV